MASEKVDNFPTRLREFRKRNGLSQVETGEKLGVSSDYVSQLENNRKVASSSLRLLLDELERSPLYGPKRLGSLSETKAPYASTPNAVPTATPMMPLISWAQGGMATAFEEIPQEWQEEVPNISNDPKAFAIELRGDSMEPKYQEGDIITVMPSTFARNGDLVVAKIKDEGFAFKILNLVGGDPNQIRLKSYNSLYEPMDLRREQLHWIYPVHSVTKIVRR